MWHDGSENGKPATCQARQTGGLVYADAEPNQRLDLPASSRTYSGPQRLVSLDRAGGKLCGGRSRCLRGPAGDLAQQRLVSCDAGRAGRVIAGKDFWQPAAADG